MRAETHNVVGHISQHHLLLLLIIVSITPITRWWAGTCGYFRKSVAVSYVIIASKFINFECTWLSKVVMSLGFVAGN